MEHPPPTSTSSLQWMPHFSISNPPRPPFASRNISTLGLPTFTPPSASATPISRPLHQTTPPSHHQILDLQADIKEVLEHVVASHEEQKKISKDVDELATKVKVLERVLCGDVGRAKKKRKNTDSDAVNKGGMAHRLVEMESAMDELLGLVTSLKTARGPPVVYHDACTPSPSVQRGYANTSDGHLPANMPPSTRPFRPLLSAPLCSSGSLAPVDYNTNPSIRMHAATVSRRASLPRYLPYFQEHSHSFHRDYNSFGSTHLDPRTPLDVFTTASFSLTHNASSRPVPNTLHTQVSANQPDRFISSSLATPSLGSPRGERFGRPNDGSNSRPFGGSQPGLGCPDQSSSMTPPSRMSRTPARACVPPKFNSRNFTSPLKYNTAPSHLTQTSSPTSFDQNIPATNPTPISPTASHSLSFTNSAMMRSLSPTRMPNSALSRARAASLSSVFSGAQPNIGGNVDCEGSCADCAAEHGKVVPDSRHRLGREDVEEFTEEDLRMESEGPNVDRFFEESVKSAENQNQNKGREYLQEFLTDTEDNVQPENVVSESEPTQLTSSDPPRLDTDPLDRRESPHAEGSREPTPTDPEDNVQPQIVLPEPSQPTSSDPPRFDDRLDQYESFHVKDAREPTPTGPEDNIQPEIVHSEPCQPISSDPPYFSDHLDQYESLHVEDVREPTPTNPEDDVQPEIVLPEPLRPTSSDPPCFDDHLDTYEPLHTEDAREPTPTGPEDNIHSETVLHKPRQPTPSDLPYCDDHPDQHEPLYAEGAREPTPSDYLFRDDSEEVVAAVLAAASLTPEGACTPSPPTPERLSAFMPELDAQIERSPWMRDKGRGATSSETREEMSRDRDHHADDDVFVALGRTYSDLFSDFINADTDSPISTSKTETRVQKHAVSTDHGEEVESDVQAAVKISARAETEPVDVVPDRTVESDIHTANASAQHKHEDMDPSRTVPVAVSTPLRYTSPSSLLFRLSPLSPLSSLAESLPPVENKTDAGDEAGRNETEIELHRTESHYSDEDFDAPSVLSRSISTDSRKSGTPLVTRGGPSASIEELSVLARKDPPKLHIRLSDLKRKLESYGSVIEQPEKRTKFNDDADADGVMRATSFDTDNASSSFTDAVRDSTTGEPMRQSSRPLTSMQDVTASPVDTISALMEVDSVSASTNGTTTGERATTAEMKTPTPVNGFSTQSPKKRVRALSRKARESNSTQKVRQPRKNAGGTPNRRPPQGRKSKSLSFKDKAVLMCQWPAKSEQDGSFQRQFVQCDNCDLWYHFECVGIVEEDPRLEAEATFICPPCCVSTAKRQTLRNRDERCSRPDCLHAHLDAQEFIIERLVGRKPVGEAGHLFLVKWEGYPIAQATWIPEGNMDGAAQALSRFVADAKAEGIDLRTKGVVLLEEARVGGWL